MKEQRRVLRQYYAWRLDAHLSIIDARYFNMEKVTGLRSIRSLRGNLDILMNEFGFSKTEVSYLIKLEVVKRASLC